MSDLARALGDLEPIDSFVAKCDECGEVFFNSETDAHRRGETILTARAIEIQARAHRNETGHTSLDVGVQKTAPLREIEATITVNES